MTVIDRRGMLEIVLGGLAAATTTFSLMPTSAAAMPPTLGVSANRQVVGDALVEKAAVVVSRRRVRRRVCVWSRGRRVCTWRWVWI